MRFPILTNEPRGKAAKWEADRLCRGAGTMAESRIKPFREVEEGRRRRELQERVFRRNQVYGLLIFAAAIVVWWLVHTNPAWIFPRGWWRF